MKKHFLLVVLTIVVFLGLGNYTNAQNGQICALINGYSCMNYSASCDCNVSNNDCPNGQSCCNCSTVSNDGTIYDPVSDPVDVEPTDPCLTGGDDRIMSTNNECPSGYSEESVNGVICCNPDPSGVNGADCAPPSGGTLNSLICTCPDGTKEVDKVCVSCKTEGVCCGIELNTSIPFIGNCIEDNKDDQGVGETNVTGETAFPVLMGSLTKILVTVILIVSFVLIIVGGIMIATGNPADGKKMIIKVVIGIALLGASGVVLRLINPNFFG